MSSGPERPPPKYLIVCSEGKPITHLGVVGADQLLTGFSRNLVKMESRESVLASIARGETFMTAYRKDDGKGGVSLRMGEYVRGVPDDKPRYLRTDSNDELKDNLVNLPEC